MGFHNPIKRSDSNYPNFNFTRISESKNRFQIFLENHTPKWVQKITNFFLNTVRKPQPSNSDKRSPIRTASTIYDGYSKDLEVLKTQFQSADVRHLNELKALIKDVRKDLTMLKIVQFSTADNSQSSYKDKLEDLEKQLVKKINKLSDEQKIYLSLSKNILKYCRTCDRLLEIELINQLNSQKFQDLDKELLRSLVESQLEDNLITLDRFSYILYSSSDDLKARIELLKELFQDKKPNFAIWDLVRYCTGSKVDEKSIVSELKQFKGENPDLYYKIMNDLYYKEDTIDTSQILTIRSKVE